MYFIEFIIFYISIPYAFPYTLLPVKITSTSLISTMCISDWLFQLQVKISLDAIQFQTVAIIKNIFVICIYFEVVFNIHLFGLSFNWKTVALMLLAEEMVNKVISYKLSIIAVTVKGRQGLPYSIL